MSEDKATSQRRPAPNPHPSESPPTAAPEGLAQRGATPESGQQENRRRQGYELLAQGAQLLSQRRPGEAAARLEEAAMLLPGNVDVAINLGGAYILQSRFDQAVSVLEQAGQLAPDNLQVWTNLAAAYLGRLESSGPRQQERAIAAYERALQIDPLAPHLHYNLGLIYKDRQQWSRARTYFQLALAADAQDSDAAYWLSWLAAVEAAMAQEPQPGAPNSGDDQTEPGSQEPIQRAE